MVMEQQKNFVNNSQHYVYLMVLVVLKKLHVQVILQKSVVDLLVLMEYVFGKVDNVD